MNKKLELLFKKLENKNVSIASVESFTGGLFASTIISKSGASKFFKGSLITYNNQIKKNIGIDVNNGVINKNTALQMSNYGKTYFEVDYCLSFTGNAGPKNMENKSTGYVFIAINEFVFELHIKNKTRNRIRKTAVKWAINKLIEII